MVKVFKLESFDLQVLRKALVILDYEVALAQEAARNNHEEFERSHGVALEVPHPGNRKIPIHDGDVAKMLALVEDLQGIMVDGSDLDCMAAG